MIDKLKGKEAYWMMDGKGLTDNAVNLITYELIKEATNNNDEHYKTCDVLDLSRNEITDDSVGCLANMLKNNRNLRKLDLGQNRIKYGGVKVLCDALNDQNDQNDQNDVNKTLKVLCLNSNPIGNSSLPYIREMLEKNKTLTRLRLGGLDELDEFGRKRLRSMDTRITMEGNRRSGDSVPPRISYPVVEFRSRFDLILWMGEGEIEGEKRIATSQNVWVRAACSWPYHIT